MSRRASSYTKKPIEWAWQDRLALGMSTVIDSDPSRGTSQLFACFAGHVTTGRSWPDGSSCPLGGFVYVSGEDPIEQVVLPRCEAVGADLDRIIITSTKDDGSPIRLPEDIPFVEQLVRDVDARGVAFDPIMTVLTGLTNPNSDKDVRQALTPLNDMLIRNRCFAVMRRHFNKNDKTSQALYRGMASVAFGALARTGFAIAKDPDSPGGFVFAPTKNNLARFPASLKYRIVDVDLGDGFHTSRIDWQGESHRTADELVTAFGAEASKAESGEHLLRQWLAGGPILSDVLWQRAQDLGISFRTYRRVKEDVLHCRAGQHKGRWYSFLPEHQRTWEMMRIQFQMDPSPDVHDSGSDVQTSKWTSDGTRNGHVSESTFGHLNIDMDVWRGSEVQMSMSNSLGNDGYFDAAYLEAFGAEMDAEAAELAEVETP